MKYYIYIVCLLCTVNSFSQTEIVITEDVTAGESAGQFASLITASNTIEDDALAYYGATEAIQLNEGFSAELGSSVFLLVDDIFGNFFAQKNLGENIATQNNSDLLDVGFNVYPNPSNGLFTIQSLDQITSYSVSNLLGEKVSSNTVNNNEIEVDISQFSQGLYLLEIQKENGEIVKKKIIKN